LNFRCVYITPLFIIFRSKSISYGSMRHFKLNKNGETRIMNIRAFLKTSMLVVLLVAAIIGLSLISSILWGDKPEQLPEMKELIIKDKMSIAQFGKVNNLPNPVLKNIFNLKSKPDLKKQLKEFGTPDHIRSMVGKKMALAAEHASKNWLKIPVKFACWFIFLTVIFMVFRKHTVSTALRKWMLFTAVIIFGVALGADPGPMGTVKDAVYLYGTTGAIFPPRMIALTVFLVIVFVANKYICAWGCQAGTLQDLIFRLNQTDKQRAIIGKQVKLPFVITNTVRVVFLFIFTIIVFMWGLDIINPIDPFKIYKPAHLGIIGGIFVAGLLLLSMFFYRPWCHLFCPFGLVGWLVEKISLVKISVDYETCIACMKCVNACPSTVMGAILKRDKKIIPDCFSCYTCREVCPTGSIHFSTRKRTMPPAGHFEKRNKMGEGGHNL